ncbi:MAG TPA: hypothetical protein VLC46_01740 [Thermoanaerobaculia bacterium]|jgi:hypothetical protein|nr:hypothetical protein [Thermoanaerobaculia bacterium]
MTWKLNSKQVEEVKTAERPAKNEVILRETMRWEMRAIASFSHDGSSGVKFKAPFGQYPVRTVSTAYGGAQLAVIPGLDDALLTVRDLAHTCSLRMSRP